VRERERRQEGGVGIGEIKEEPETEERIWAVQ